jgi:hypothetical protein
MRRRAGLLVVVAFALALTACLPPPPPTLPPGKATGPLQGFDACAAPSLATMSAWWSSSPYSSVGLYIGGSSIGCPIQPNRSANWVNTTISQGWKLLPIWVGPQAPCSDFSGKLQSGLTGPQAFAAGVDQANHAVDDGAIPLNITHGPIYYDLEAYPRGDPCSQTVKDFANGWVQQLHARGFEGGFYSSLCSGILDLGASVGGAGVVPQDGIWIAAWAYNSDDARYATYTPNLFGLGGCPGNLPDALWAGHERIRQFRGGHNETWGGATINIDTNAVDGLVYP